MPLELKCCHPGCSKAGNFGRGVHLRAGKIGEWWCRQHLPEDYFNHLKPEKTPLPLSPMQIKPLKQKPKPAQGSLF
jgi:hypothetical protein